MDGLDQLHLNFSEGSLKALNTALAFLMFSVSLFIEQKQLDDLRRHPRALAVGLVSQWVFMPGVTILLIWLLSPPPALALGMLLVAACPGGNVSNYFSMAAHANVVLAISLVTISTLAAAVVTPSLFAFTVQLALPAQALPGLHVDWTGMLLSVLAVVGAPLIAGRLFLRWAPVAAQRVRRPLRIAAGLLLLGIIGSGVAGNLGIFRVALGHVFTWVLLLNTLAITGGYALGAIFRLPEADRRALAIETGIHNSGLGLVLIFNFFNGSGPMALLAAWWGVWHMVSGGIVAAVWSRFPPRA